MSDLTKVYQDNTMNKQNSIDITFQNIEYSVKAKKGQKQILKGLSGICKSGEITAILGSSGAGKTSLLNILCKRVKTNSNVTLNGQILANNKPYSSEEFTEFASYVMQDDILTETLTVKECLQFAANLKIKGDYEQKSQKVNEVIKNLRLERCQNTLIGGHFVKGVSGGEKKRTSIGYEMISDPSCIFLDEPTSGLDSFTAFSIIDLMRQYAQTKNKAIIFTIHQPSSDIWNMFDRIMLLVEGRFIYQGHGGQDVINHFSSIGFKCPQLSNPADYLMSIMHQESETNRQNNQVYFQGYDLQLKSGVQSEIESSNSGDIQYKIIHTSLLYQTGQIALRQITFLKRSPILFKARFFQAIFVALFYGAVYWQLPGPHDNPSQRDVNDKNGLLFFWIVTCFMMSLKPCILAFPAERAVYLREENAKLYSVTPYFFGKFIVDIFPSVVFPLISAIIMYWMVGFNDDNAGKVFFFILISCLCGLTGLSVGYFGGSAFSNAQTASAVTPLLIMPFMLFAGYYKNASDLASWIGWIQYICPFKYSFIALIESEYTYSDGVGYPQDPIKQLDINLSRWESFGCMAGLFAFYTICAYFFLASLKKRVQ